MNLPPEFISNIQNTFREDGYTFLAALPSLVAEASERWGLTDVQPAPNLSYNFVAFALSGASDGGPSRSVVLKIAVPNREFKSEMAALHLFNGDGACRLIDYDEEKYWMLLEWLKPGVMLSMLEDDEEATHIAAEVMKKIWKPISLDTPFATAQGYSTSGSEFIQLTDWFDGLKKLRPIFGGKTGPLDEKLVERVERSVEEFFDENHMPVLMHGDFHHFNILSSSERGWLVIDPKGVIGPAGYEVGPFMLNPWGSLLNSDQARAVIKRRIDILHEHLGWERERIREWSLAHAVLSAWWGVEDNADWRYSLNVAEMMASL